VLGYLGKETDSSALRFLMESGLPLKLFGSKSAGFVRKLTQGRLPPNVQVLGRVSSEELQDLYTNALFMAFPFTDEPFGLVPLESMACGTPVLTYNTQGPAETVLHGRTGWLVNTPEDLLREALRLFTEGYPAWIPNACLLRVRRYSVDNIASAWEDLLRATFRGQSDPSSVVPIELPEKGLFPAPELPLPSRVPQLPVGSASPAIERLGYSIPTTLETGSSLKFYQESASKSGAFLFRGPGSSLDTVRGSQQGVRAGPPGDDQDRTATAAMVDRGQPILGKAAEDYGNSLNGPVRPAATGEEMKRDYRLSSDDLLEVSFRANEAARSKSARRDAGETGTPESRK
jgi:hypothetical protein